MSPKRVLAFRYLIIFSLYLTATSITTHLYFDQQSASLSRTTEQLIFNTSQRPFVYRVLSHWSLGKLSEATPEAIKQRLRTNKKGELRELDGIKHYQWTGNHPHIFILSYLWVFLFLLLSIFCWRLILSKTLSMTPFGLDIAPVIAMLALPHLFMKSGFIYDTSELFFFSAGLLLFLRKNWLLYYACFALAVTNKETGILMGAWLLLPLVNRQWRYIFSHGAAHLAVSLPILISIRMYYAETSGSAMEFHLWENIDFFFSSKPWLQFDDAYAFHLPTTRSFNIINILLVTLPLITYWKHLNVEIKWIFTTLLITLFPLYLVCGLKDEIRVFLPLVPSFLILYTDAMKHLYTSIQTSENDDKNKRITT